MKLFHKDSVKKIQGLLNIANEYMKRQIIQHTAMQLIKSSIEICETFPLLGDYGTREIPPRLTS